KFAAEGGFRTNVQPKSEMGAQSHSVKSAEVITIDAANHAASDERENVAVGENHGAGFERRNDAMFELIEKVGAVHQRESQASDGVFCQQLVDVATDKIRAAQATGLHGEAFGLQPLLQQTDLGGAAGAVHTFDDDKRAGN